MRMNTAKRFHPNAFNHEGTPTYADKPEKELRRAVMSCLLWENSFYESGVAIADRIVGLAESCNPIYVADLAIEARIQFHLRHAPLLLLTVLAKTGAGREKLVANTVYSVIQRSDEAAELLALYWRNGRTPIANQLKKGLARALTKFDAYRLAKYDRDTKVKMRDVMFLTHPRPKNEEQATNFIKLINGTLESPDTWEVALSAGADKKETFLRLLTAGNLGYLALLRNLRNMIDADVPTPLIFQAIIARKNGADKVFPFRYIAAARAAPQCEPALDTALCSAIGEMTEMKGNTIILVDVSGSMACPLSGRSDMKRMDAAAALSAIFPGQRRVFSFSQSLVEVPPRRGMAGVDAVIASQPHGGTLLGAAVTAINENFDHDRLIVITDEQSHDIVPAPKAKRGYMINVAGYKNSVARDGAWIRINGFSENVLRYIREVEEQ